MNTFLRTLTILAATLALLLVAGCGGGPEGGRVILLGLDGLDPVAVDQLMAEGKLPNLARMRQEGAYGLLRSQHPLLSPIVWTTIATGKGPPEHGIGHFVAVGADGQEVPATSTMRKVEALWTIASKAGRKVVSVGYWATWPPEAVDGLMVSDHVAYHFLFEAGLQRGAAPAAGSPARVHPPEREAEILAKIERPHQLTAADLAPFVDVDPAELDQPFRFEEDLAHFRWALATARSYSQLGLDLWRAEKPQLELVYLEATDSTAHLFGHLYRAEGLQGELAEQQKRYGRAVEAIYVYADQVVGRYLDAMDRNTTLIVLSDHGFELGKLHDDPGRTRDLRRVSEKFHREDGVIYLAGRHVRPGARIQGAGILDVTPTVLALLGLPAGADMPGKVLADGIDAPIPERKATWEDGSRAAATAAAADVPRDAAADQALTEHLRSLGYLSGAPGEARSPEGDRNLAAILFNDKRYRESAQLYHALIEANPGDAGLHTSLAGALGALGRYEQAKEELEKAIALAPLNVEAYHNRAVVEERLGDKSAAIEDYRRALRYQPDYQPSVRALQRLTGSSEPRALREQDRRAQQLLDQAADAARHTDYPKAKDLLDQAEKIAPDFVMVHQYRSNVAYLAGDRAGAIRALERALEIEPDNALFRRNLDKLRADEPRR